MFVDQPVGTGFSYADYGEFVDTTEDAAQDIVAFMVLFFENFPSFKNRALHMAGESYGGRYIPLFSAAIWDQNAQLVARGLTPVNLTSAMIGNGLTDPYTMTPSYYDMTCTPASVPPVLDINTCVRMKQALPLCEKWLKESCLDHLDHMACAAAEQFCETELMAPIESIDINPHDISKPCGSKELICYPIVQEITKYLDNPDTRSMLGVDPAASQNFQDCNLDVMFTFLRNGDRQRPSHEYVAALLERGVRVLVYVGDFDWVCNWIGNERWTLALEWSGHGEFRAEKLRDWEVDGEIAGKTRSAEGFTFATITGAGHMAPYDKPKQSLALIQRWMAGAAL
ncbi:hypothetical protein EWM64_g7980 [Hericium alpestre]|uniref:Carboxypeptidase n=1 Tax=Hericium alpestre TaxID=135208 RepID=A0A4Y9ZPT6_9AGAM|nr:hypothetical protein EWM64_g7980 [Hericium alpestre]